MGLDEQVMPHIDMANIACGFHAGDADIMASTLSLAKKHKVTIGAHPSYPDKQGFGRRSMAMSEKELTNCLHYQIAAIDGMAAVHGLTLEYVKPHGALYNDMMREEHTLNIVMQAVARYPKPLKLMILATNQAAKHKALATELGIELILEAFADRQYTDEGKLVSRALAGSVLEKPALLKQVKQLIEHGTVTTQSGQQLTLHADSLCVHGDNDAGIALIQEINALCQV